MLAPMQFTNLLLPYHHTPLVGEAAIERVESPLNETTLF
jgi:hypothetical protein